MPPTPGRRALPGGGPGGGRRQEATGGHAGRHVRSWRSPLCRHSGVPPRAVAGLWAGGQHWEGQGDTASRTYSGDTSGRPSQVPQTERLPPEASVLPQLWGPGVGAPGRTGVPSRALRLRCVCGGPRFCEHAIAVGLGTPSCNMASSSKSKDGSAVCHARVGPNR